MNYDPNVDPFKSFLANTAFSGTWQEGIYASHWVGRETVPQPDGVGDADARGLSARGTNWRMLTVRETIQGFSPISNVSTGDWMPWTAPIAAWFARWLGPQPRRNAWESPIDLDVGEHIVRFGPFPSGTRPFPYPYQIGAISGFMPMLDNLSMKWAWARNPFGPGVQTPIPIGWQITYQDLRKTTA